MILGWPNCSYACLLAFLRNPKSMPVEFRRHREYSETASRQTTRDPQN
jgi:hypothetical protein